MDDKAHTNRTYACCRTVHPTIVEQNRTLRIFNGLVRHFIVNFDPWSSITVNTDTRQYQVKKYTHKNACSVTAYNSTDIRSVQDNVATPVTAMMVTVCISSEH